MTHQELELPKGWVETKLEEVVSSVKGKKPTNLSKKPEKGYLPYLLIDELEGKQIRNYTNDVRCPVANKNDVLIVWDGSIGKLGLGLTGVIGSTISALSPIIIESEYLFNYLLYKKPIIENSPRGSGLAHINPTLFWNMDFPLCSLNEQKRIVSKIEELFSKIDSTKQSLEHTKLQLELYKQSLLEFAFEGKLTEKWREENLTNLESGYNLIKRIKIKDDEPLLENLPEKWALTSIGTLFKVKPGSTPSRKNEAYWSGKISWVSSGEVKNHNIIETKEKITEDGFKNSSLMLYPSETVLLAMIGEGKTRGQVAILKIPATTNQNIAAILCADSEISSRYIFFWFLKRYTETRKAGSGGMQKALNSQRVRDQPLVLAPIKEQEQIISQIEQGFSLIENSQRIVNSTLQTLETMRMSVLKQAFQGKLVPQDPNDEPASVLLERIQKEKLKIRQ